MRALLLFITVLFSPALAQADALANAQQAYRAGAPHLALSIVNQAQGDMRGATWYEWESLRLSLLSASHQAPQILARSRLYTADVPRDFQQKALGHLAWAELELKHGAEVRRSLSQLLWQFDLLAADQQWARRLVIRSYLLDHRADEAYRAMLRYDQDYAPIGREVATEFVQGLLVEGRANEALSWLPQLDPAGAIALRLKLKAGLSPASAVLKQAQTGARQAKAQPSFLLVIADAAEMLQDNALKLLAQEQWLDNTEETASLEQALWQGYLDYAAALGNRAQLLQGDEAAWLSYAQTIQTSDPLGARAVYAYSAMQLRGAAEREQALMNFLTQLVAQGHEGSAARLINARPWGGPKLEADFFARWLNQNSVMSSDSLRRKVSSTVGRSLLQRQENLNAAAYFADAALAGPGVWDKDSEYATQMTAKSLTQAGYSDEAALWSRYIVSQRTQAIKPKSKLPRKR